MSNESQMKEQCCAVTNIRVRKGRELESDLQEHARGARLSRRALEQRTHAHCRCIRGACDNGVYCCTFRVRAKVQYFSSTALAIVLLQ